MEVIWWCTGRGRTRVKCWGRGPCAYYAVGRESLVARLPCHWTYLVAVVLCVYDSLGGYGAANRVTLERDGRFMQAAMKGTHTYYKYIMRRGF